MKTVAKGHGAMLNDEKLDGLCRDCGQAFSLFLHEMADHNAKVAACPRCGKPHLHKRPKVKPDKPVAAQRRARKILTDH
jgi:Zn finger protein HypA/HybF involved in hydrogenase expression